MRAVIQRVSSASLIANGQPVGAITKGLVILVGIEEADLESDADWLVAKISTMRIFQDAEDKMNLALEEVKGRVMVVSQFTLFASTKKGNRPSFIRAARPETAIPLYQAFLTKMAATVSQPIVAGVFGADMKITLVNDGPVTIVMDSKSRE